MILELNNIYKTYTQGKLEVPVLKDVSMSVEEGDYVAIMGPSGSGKTTLMNIIGCLDYPTSGEYSLDGENVLIDNDSKLSEVRLRSIGFVFQSFHLMPRETALENVALPLLYAGVKKRERLEIAKKALIRVGLEDRIDFKPTQLSGGQCQRVAIARAIVNNPKILLADEPTGALDTTSGEQIMDLFKSLNSEGVTVVMITHEKEIAYHARKIFHIRDGQIVKTIFNDPDSNYDSDHEISSHSSINYSSYSMDEDNSDSYDSDYDNSHGDYDGDRSSDYDSDRSSDYDSDRSSDYDSDRSSDYDSDSDADNYADNDYDENAEIPEDETVYNTDETENTDESDQSSENPIGKSPLPEEI